MEPTNYCALSVEIEDNAIVIRLPFDALESATKYCPDLNEMAEDFEVEVVDINEWANDVLHELTMEEEDGTTPVMRLFDAAFADAAENGSLGISLGDDE